LSGQRQSGHNTIHAKRISLPIQGIALYRSPCTARIIEHFIEPLLRHQHRARSPGLRQNSAFYFMPELRLNTRPFASIASMAMFKRVSPWIACLALLLNMLAMPLSRALQTPDIGLMLWGGFCSGGASQARLCQTDRPIAVGPGTQHHEAQRLLLWSCRIGRPAFQPLPASAAALYTRYRPRQPVAANVATQGPLAGPQPARLSSRLIAPNPALSAFHCGRLEHP
jgi:hypothetical protein